MGQHVRHVLLGDVEELGIEEHLRPHAVSVEFNVVERVGVDDAPDGPEAQVDVDAPRPALRDEAVEVADDARVPDVFAQIVASLGLDHVKANGVREGADVGAAPVKQVRVLGGPKACRCAVLEL